MNILFKPCGMYETNCYILGFDGFEIIIDPGINSEKWVMEKCKNPVAILNTHGHFDHIWGNANLQKDTNAKLYTPNDDSFMLQEDIFGMQMPVSTPDVLVQPDERININGIEVIFHHFPGHTPGCSAIEVEGHLFSGDFVFKNSIGRTDFPYSSSKQMAESLKKFGQMTTDMPIHPGHGAKTSILAEQANISQWLRYLGE